MTTIQTDAPATPEEVWAILREVGRKQEELAEAQKETARQMKETDLQMKETDLQIKETARQMKETDLRMKETDIQMKETGLRIDDFNKRFGEFTNRFGEVVEYMIAPNLREKFRELGLDFPNAGPNRDVSDHKNKIYFEVDIFLENGDRAMLVEVKTKLTTEHVNDHIERLEKMRKYADLHGDKRSLLGAVAGVVIASNVKNYALGQGFYVIEPSGKTFLITKPYNEPKEW
uniref:DUF3782 domain-containing protein n=1 Tax=uncultured bacterium contig00051 TaxID=1181535 RepID=A0A806KLK5_9BACT|nr:hypothetical protein [uncultured bacterium contig00051]